MASIDDRVVSMTFKSAEFLTGAAMVMSALQKLKDSLSGLKGSGKALTDLNSVGKNVDLSHIGSAVDSIRSKFSALSVVAISALATIANRAVAAGMQLVKSVTVAPIMAGLHEYENELNTTAVIMANTGLAGEKGMAQIRTALGELNTYADKTIYSFEDMTSAIGKFTAAGVSLGDSVVAIKGLANLAALSGSTAQQAAVAQYQLSQAIATGTIRLMDWNSVVNAGMGGKVFQNSLIETARVHGVAVDSMIKENGSFRESLQEGWLSSKILLETLSKFTGDLGEQQLKQMGYTDKQIAQIQKQAQAAVDAATKIRTVTQLMSALGEAVQSSWAGVFRALFGNMEEATKLWTSVGGALTKAFVGPVNGLQKLISGWSELGGREILIQALAQAFRVLGDVLRPIGQAFRDVFPAMTVDRLLNMTLAFHKFIFSLEPGKKALQGLHNTFQGVFSALRIGWEIVKGVFSVIGTVIKALFGVGGSFLEVTGKIGNFITRLKDSIVSGEAFSKFFGTIGKILAAPVKGIGLLAHGFSLLIDGVEKAFSAMKPFFDWLGKAFSKIGDAIARGLESGDLSNVVNVLNEVLIAGILFTIRKFLKNLKISLPGAGLLDTIKSAFTGLTGALKAMQTNLNAGTLKKIAIAVALLSASLLALSFIDAKNLTKSLTAITVMFTQLVGAMALISKISANVVQIFAISAAMNLIASAILILAGAVAILAGFTWEELAKGVSTVAAMLALLVAAIKILSKNTGSVTAAAGAMILMAVALNIMALAVRQLGSMDWGSLIKGVATIGALLLVMAGFNKIGGGEKLIATAAAMLIVGAALSVIARAVGTLGQMKTGDLVKGLVGVAAALGIIAAAMWLMPTDMLSTAASLLVVSVALTIIGKAVESMGKMSWSEIARSLVALAGALIILSLGVNMMTGALSGAAAMLVVSAALSILAGVLTTLGEMSWSEILKSLVALAGAFLLIGAAGLLLGPLVPVLIGLGVAIALFGAGMLAVGAGVFLLGTGLTALGAALLVSGTAIVAFVKSLIGLIPYAVQKIGEGIVAFANVIGRSGVAITKAFTAILTALLQAIIKVMPLIGQAISKILDLILKLIVQYAKPAAKAMSTLIGAVLDEIRKHVGDFTQKGIDILVGFLNGIARNLGRVIAAGTNVIIAFIRGIGDSASRVVQAGIDTIIKFVNSLASQIRNSSGALRSAAGNLASAIIDGLTFGLWSKAGAAIDAARSIASQILGALGGVFRFFSPSHETMEMGALVSEGFAVGLKKSEPEVIAAAKRTGNVILTALAGIGSDLEDVKLQPVITPVIDLTGVKRGFDDLAAMNRTQLAIGTTMTAAAAISATGVPGVSEREVIVAGGTNVSFQQYNTSPKALSSAEIYRQTRNQLSVMKGGLP